MISGIYVTHIYIYDSRMTYTPHIWVTPIVLASTSHQSDLSLLDIYNIHYPVNIYDNKKVN